MKRDEKTIRQIKTMFLNKGIQMLMKNTPNKWEHLDEACENVKPDQTTKTKKILWFFIWAESKINKN